MFNVAVFTCRTVIGDDAVAQHHAGTIGIINCGAARFVLLIDGASGAVAGHSDVLQRCGRESAAGMINAAAK